MSLNNNEAPNDYWTDKWLTGNELDGGTDWSDEGGYVRDRPLPRPPRPGSSETWKRADAEQEVRWALDGGLDGWITNHFSTDPSNTNNVRYGYARDAANSVAPGFLIVPMVDTGGSSFDETSPTSAVSDFLATYAYEAPVRGKTSGNVWLPSAYRLADGRFVVNSFRPESNSLTWFVTMMMDHREMCARH